ncbi:MAG: hypothetical protein KBA40_04035 [Candidatus Peribacteraceae bacterium]|nr:hypothetical protein [Candidatus Peribacteraceae bacterium]
MEADIVQEGMAIKLTTKKFEELQSLDGFNPRSAVQGLVAEVRQNGSIRVVLGDNEDQVELEVTADDIDLL